MNVSEVPEDGARKMRCPACAAQVGKPCRSSSLSHSRTLKRAHLQRRRRWLNRWGTSGNEEMSS